MNRKIELGELIDLIDDNNWGEYECEYEMPDGTFRKGTVESDGNEIWESSLRDENGNKVT
jgi:hypothetical protein